MTDFQMSLIAAGGVFVVGVITYTKWQEYKARKSVERAFASDHDDVLMRSGAEPALGDAEADGLQRQEPVLDLSAEPPLAPLTPLSPVAGAPSAPAPSAAPASSRSPAPRP